ncbi:MAG TPA: glycine cleavage system aminomethyltransferase GcvT [Acidimicrobiia bacterium]
MNRSPLHQLNESLGARFVDFGGWEMPLQYESVLAEHRAVRESVGVFDVTHLGRFELTGNGAHDAISSLLCNDIDKIAPGRCQYTMMLNEDGGIIDDLIVWWWEPERFWVMPNAANQERVMEAFAGRPGCAVADMQKSTVFLAVQGPKAPDLLVEVVGDKPARFRTAREDWDGGEVAMAGTGYTGETGAELCVDPAIGARLFEALVDAGARPCGLGSRDTLRLEAGLALWGADIDETTTPLEAGLTFAVSLDHEFVGREALIAQTEEGVPRALTGFVLEGRGIPRHGHSVTTAGGGGTVTSGNLSPMLDTGVGMAYISPPPSPGDSISVTIRDREVPGHIATPPFHRT